LRSSVAVAGRSPTKLRATVLLDPLDLDVCACSRSRSSPSSVLHIYCEKGSQISEGRGGDAGEKFLGRLAAIRRQFAMHQLQLARRKNRSAGRSRGGHATFFF
jgi:hypothetical protein